MRSLRRQVTNDEDPQEGYLHFVDADLLGIWQRGRTQQHDRVFR